MKKRNKILIILTVGILAIFLFIVADKIFGLISEPKITSVYPENNSQNIACNSEITINFDKPVARQEILSSIHLVIAEENEFNFTESEVLGQWEFKNPLIDNSVLSTSQHLFKTLVFTPAINFSPDTDYLIRIENIESIAGQKNNSFSFTFKTEGAGSTQALVNTTSTASDATTTTNALEEPEIILIKTVFNWQKYKLSCEAASLKMALSAKGMTVSEDEIMEKVGYDTTPHQDGIWGDPNIAFVGDINGKMCNTGYGVHWEPLAKAANNWRTAEAFSGWTLDKLIDELNSQNPVVMWGTLPVSTLHSYSWHTPEGKYIEVYRETHVRLVVGFIGEAENPTKIIMNDPLSGKLYWDTEYFMKNWQSFSYSGVVVR